MALWRSCCAAILEDGAVNWRVVVWTVKGNLLDNFSQVWCFKCFKVNDQCIFMKLNCHLVPIITKSPIVVAWLRSRNECFILNVDGSLLGKPNAVGGGGILRDEGGHAITGFANFYGVSKNTVAEGRPLLDGLRLAQQLGLNNIMVESYSFVVVDVLKMVFATFSICGIF